MSANIFRLKGLPRTTKDMSLIHMRLFLVSPWSYGGLLFLMIGDFIFFFLVKRKFGGEDMIAKKKKSFFKGYQMQPWAKLHLFYKLGYVMNRCFTSEETPCSNGGFSWSQEIGVQIQERLDHVASIGERISNTFNWTVGFQSTLALVVLTVVALILYLIPLRALMLIYGCHKVLDDRLRAKVINFVSHYAPDFLTSQ